ncbi:MAG: RecQ family ATP-dependent DNA helicase [Thermodesulfobacteriota bacterium]
MQDRVCATALEQLAAEMAASQESWPAMAYCLAWLRVAGGSSVLPPWVRHRFPEAATILRRLRSQPCPDPGCRFCQEAHDPAAGLATFFGLPSFRPRPAGPDGGSLQEAIVRHAAAGQPLLAILPTGGGKSLCYQLPALRRHQHRGVLTVVISPLVALMKDQVDNLQARTGAPSGAALSGLLTPPERGAVLERVRLGDVAILYLSPEQLRNRSAMEAIGSREIGAWVVDEAHCLSKWGHDFRPDYLYLARAIRDLASRCRQPLPPVQCFTATAKPDVLAEIVDHFRRELGQELTLFQGGVERENLRFEVFSVGRLEKQATTREILAERLAADGSGSAVVYTATRQGAERAAAFLTEAGWPAAHYHGGLDPVARRQIQEDFLAGRVRVICATNAFGMGIDKEDVRLVIHQDIPGSLESYLQEAGRAGRDNRAADCVLLYDEADIEKQFQLGAASQLTQRDLAQFLRGLRRAKTGPDGQVVITAGEMLRLETVDTAIDRTDRQADTLVRTAVSWLERAGFLERNENRTQVFQGRPLVASLEEARLRIRQLGCPRREQERMLAIMAELLASRSDQGFSADQLAELAPFASVAGEDREAETASQRVIRTLHAMAEAGLLQKNLMPGQPDLAPSGPGSVPGAAAAGLAGAHGDSPPAPGGRLGGLADHPPPHPGRIASQRQPAGGVCRRGHPGRPQGGSLSGRPAPRPPGRHRPGTDVPPRAAGDHPAAGAGGLPPSHDHPHPGRPQTALHQRRLRTPGPPLCRAGLPGARHE